MSFYTKTRNILVYFKVHQATSHDMDYAKGLKYIKGKKKKKKTKHYKRLISNKFDQPKIDGILKFLAQLHTYTY